MMREVIAFNENWLFHEGEIITGNSAAKGLMYQQAKTERKLVGPASINYPDGVDAYGGPKATVETWIKAEAPHDYVIGQAPKKENNNALGYFAYNNAWYRKHFELRAEDEGRRAVLFFEGVGIHTTVYVNGCRMLHNHCGYNSFEVDFTDVARFGQENVVALHIDAQEHEGWWYEGAGIYRPVWLILTEEVSVDQYGVFVHPELAQNDEWTVPVETEIRNDGYEEANVEVKTTLCALDGEVIAERMDTLSIAFRAKNTLKQMLFVKAPSLWDIDSPTLYVAKTDVYKGGERIDHVENRFGFRTIRFDAERGFFLNGRHVLIQGVCCHQDYGITGKAVPERVQKYRLRLLKEMGANGYRTAHYPQHAATMDALDEIGFLVMAETRWFESTPEGMEQLRMLIKRDRNHPCVILWSAGNEEPMHIAPQGRRIARAMLAEMRRLDPTRPVTTAVSHSPLQSTVMDVVDVIGVNYNFEAYDRLHEMYPTQPFLSSECCATSTTRGWYLEDCEKRGYIYGYDRDTNAWFRGREATWKFLTARPWVAGGFQWAGIEHRGETTWPRLCSQSGALDLFLQRKDAFYQNQSMWTEKPMVHILPHWNLQGREGEKVRVSVYTNCDKVELYQDGVSMGAKEVEKFGHAEWQLTYRKGSVRAVGFRNGERAAEETVETTGKPVGLRLKLESGGVRADGSDVAIITCECVDESGRFVPDASPFVYFDTNGLGKIVGTGSDVSDPVPVTSPDRKMRAGLISVLVRAGKEKGTLRVYARADGLKSARLDIELAE